MTVRYPTASPAKLRDGSWGARVEGTPKPGDIVEIITKSGKTWFVRVDSIIWSGPDKYNDGGPISLCETSSVEDDPAVADSGKHGRENPDPDDNIPF